MHTVDNDDFFEQAQQAEPWEKFCDSNCVWTDHHPDCKLAQQAEHALDCTKVACMGNNGCVGTCWNKDTSPPPRQPLTDEQINEQRLSLGYDYEDLPDPWDFAQGVRAAERAHNIKGEA